MILALLLVAVSGSALPAYFDDLSALRHRQGLAGRPAPETVSNYDVLHYDIAFEIQTDVQELAGTTGITLTPTGSAISQVVLDLRSLDVSSITAGGTPLTFTHEGDALTVDLASPLAPGGQVELLVTCSGHPWNEGAGKFGGFWFHPYVSYQMGVGVYSEQPSMGRCMFPCQDHPSDKATFEFHVTVDDSVEVVANGHLDGVTYAGGKATWNWSMDEPMSTYLAAVSASEYVDLVDSTYGWIHYYVYPVDVADALGSFPNVALMMDRLVSLFGPYPWDCKFSYVETPKGDMEHTSEVYHLQSLINGTTYADPILVHEMGHMWWGDCVTEDDWSDVWLSEGFATYCEALWAETYGAPAYAQYMVEDIMVPYLQSGETFPLGAPEELWGYTTYEKGASVLHMLRYVLGDEDFFAALNGYFGDHAFGLATTQDLRDHIESVTGQDIDWFVDEWVYGYGYPIYSIDYVVDGSGSDWDVTFDVHQDQWFGTFFTMPIQFSLEGSGSDTLVTMWNDVQDDTETFNIPFQPTVVRFDPQHRILSTALLGTPPSPPPGGAGLFRLAPNPARGAVTLSWPGMETADIDVAVFDMSGRCVMSSVMVVEEGTLDAGGLPAGMYIVEASAPGGIRQSTRLTVLD
jgi:aminopeptidase N